MKKKWVAVMWISTSYIGLIIEAESEQEAKFLAQALVARKYPKIKNVPHPIIAPLMFDKTELMNPSER